jgi:hypothetical protein
MKKVIIGIAAAAVVAVVLLAVFGVIGGGGFVIVGSGDLTTKNFDLSDFTEIVARSGFQLEIAKSSTFSVEVTADDNAMDYINVSKSGNTLRIGPQWNRSFRSVTLTAKITMPDLHEIKLSGGSQASISGFSSSHDLSVGLSGGSRVTGDITAGDVYLSLSGGSHVNLSGSANELVATGSGGSHISLSGSAENIVIKGSGGSHFNLQDYSVSDADINLSGGSHAYVHVNGTLNVDISGGSEVHYTGEPTLGDIDVDWDSELIEK